jgi:hypothetical protein
MTDDLLVALIIGLSLIVPFGLIAWWLLLRFRRRQLQHQAWMAALEKGAQMPPVGGFDVSPAGTRTYLLHGLIWLMCGITLTIFLGAVWATSRTQPSLEAQLRQIRELRELGYSEQDLGNFAAQVKYRYPFQRQGPGFPLGLALVGLVPAGVGIAYLVFYRLETRRARQEK